MLTHRGVAEAAVVGMPHPVKGQAVYAYVTLKRNVELTADLIEGKQYHDKTPATAAAGDSPGKV